MSLRLANGKIGSMLQIAYFSTAAVPQSDEVLHDILTVARTRNHRDGISGVLVAGGNRYMQVIEGPRLAMEALWAAIRADQRHCAVTQLLKRPVAEPSFNRWSMALRRDARIGEFDSFPQTLRYLTSHVEDASLRRQIEFLARSFIALEGGGGSEPAPTAWGLAL